MNRSSALRCIVLGSGSAGNCTAVTDGSTTVLIDCGFSAREVSRRLAATDIDLSTVAAILITHEHGDHVRGIDVFCRRHAPQAVLYASVGTRRAGGLDDLDAHVVSLAAGEPVTIGGLDVVAFSTSHDAAQPFGYRLSHGADAIGVATDTGVLTDEAAEALSGCSVIALESNHDVEMLERGPYPYHLKRRILSHRGHLSNADAADAIERLASDRLRHVIGMHRSRTNNTARLAGVALEARLKAIGIDVPVTVAAQESPCGSVDL